MNAPADGLIEEQFQGAGDALDGRRAEREAGADRRQQPGASEPPPGRTAFPGSSQDAARADPGAERVQQHRPRNRDLT